VINLPLVCWKAFTLFWVYIHKPEADVNLALIVAGLVFLLLVSLRLLHWMEQTGAWLAALIRMLGALLVAAIAVSGVFTLVFGIAVWFGGREAPPEYAEVIQALYKSLIHPAVTGAIAGLIAGMVAVFYLTRYTIPHFATMLARGTRKSHDEELTDARTVSDLLPESVHYDPRRYFDSCQRRGEVFVGLERSKKSVTVSVQRALQSHLQLVGPTGSGKGVAGQTLLSQAIRRGEAVIVFDPKVDGDKWLPSVLYSECKAAGTPFRFINLCTELPQFNLLKDATGREIIQLLTTGLRLGRRGSEADFYRLAERAFAKRGAQGEFGIPTSIPALADALREAAGDDAEKLRGLLDQIDELADIPAIQTDEGVGLDAVLEQGGVLYIAGSDADEDILLLQPMIVLRLIQLIRRRERDTGRHVTMFLDEVKYLLSVPVINSLGLIRDRGCSLILAHQALEDLVCIDADRATTEGAVRINCTLRLCYRQTDPRTVQWIEEQTGKILVNAESREISRNPALSEVPHEVRRVQQVQRAKIDANMIQQLPDGCGVLIGAGASKLVFTSPIRVERLKFTPGAANKISRRGVETLLREDDGSKTVGLDGLSP